MSKKPTSKRNVRRALERDAKKLPRKFAREHVLASDSDRLAKKRGRLVGLETGGAPERPIEVESASVIEIGAKALSCARCEGPLRLDEHAATMFAGRSLRVVRLSCRRCGAGREVFFRIVSVLPS